MKLSFNTEGKREITEANFNYYATPFVHPARKLSDHDFIYLLEGEWAFSVGGEEFVLEPDCLLILSAGVPHSGISHCKKGTKTMYFHATFSEGDSSGEALVPAFLRLPKNNKIGKLFSEIVSAKQMEKEKKASLLFNLLILEIMEYSAKNQLGSAPEKVRDIIHKHPECFFKNSELAASVGISVKGLETKFRAQFGLSIHKYMLLTKIEQAKLDLQNYPNMPIREISYNLGFYDEYHFSKQFKKLTGLSPSEFRRGK